MAIDGGEGGGRIRLGQLLAIAVRKEGCSTRTDPDDFWMYDNGYLLFQGLISSNSVCWWNAALTGAVQGLSYRGYVAPGALLVSAELCALEVVRNAWAKRVLQPPPGYQIISLEDVEECRTASVGRTQWTPLPEAVCAAVLRLSAQGKPAGVASLREALINAFPHVAPPTEQALFDTLAQLTSERKLYHAAGGYYIVTPERRRSRSHSRTRSKREDHIEHHSVTNKTMLMSTEEAMVMVHGDMTSIRDGNVTHQCIQTNLADVICGGNASDKVLYPRPKRRCSSFPAPTRSPDRRPFRLWGTGRRLRRSASTRTIHKRCAPVPAGSAGGSPVTDTSSSTECAGVDEPVPVPKKESLLSRLFRRSKRSQCQIVTFGAQFPPTEWFNSKAIHLHNVGTQTSSNHKDTGLSIPSYLDRCDTSTPSPRSASLPRRHRRQISSDLAFSSSLTASREHSPVHHLNPSYSSSTLPRRVMGRSRDSSRKASRSSLSKETTSQKNVPVEEEALQVKHVPSIDNSGPSSIESHKGSSVASGPSSIESHKTVINRGKIPESPKVKKNKSKNPSQNMTTSNSFTFQVTTNQGTVSNGGSNATATATINGNNAKIFVQNSPVRSVITFENGQADDNPNLVIINGEASSNVTENDKVKSDEHEIPTKNTNKESQLSLNNETNEKPNEMNNSRKFSLQLPSSNKDNLNFHNLLKNVSASQHNQYNSNSNPDSPIANTFRGFSKNSLFSNSNPSSPTKSCEGLQLSTSKNFKNEVVGSKSSLYENGKLLDKTVIGSEPNICYKEKSVARENSKQQFPSVSDLSFNFTSLAAQKILKGVSINSVDTLVELNMAANMEKQNNCDVVRTDFGLF